MSPAKPKRMGNTQEFKALCAQIGDAIRKAREAKKLSPAEFAARLNLSVDAVDKIENGKSTAQYAKLAGLAKTLDTTPNDLLGVTVAPVEHEAVRGLLEAAFVSLGRPLEQAVPLARAVLKVLERRALHSSGNPLRDTARTLALDAIDEFVRSRPPQ